MKHLIPGLAQDTKPTALVRHLARSAASRARGVTNVLRFDIDRPMSLAAHLERWADKAPRRTFLKFEGRRISYKVFNERVARRAAVLRKLGVKPGDVVSVMMPNRPAFVVNALALNRVGAVAALINTNLVHAGLRHAVLVTEPRAIIVDATLVEPLVEAFADHRGEDGTGELPIKVWIDTEGGTEVPPAAVEALSWRRLGVSDARQPVVDLVETDDRLAYGASAPLEPVKGSDLAAYIYTSGTTGLPKAGKVLNGRLIMAGNAFGLAIPGMSPDDTIYCCLPMFHGNGFMVALGSALACGASFALARRFSASRFWTDVSSTEATAFCYIGEVCRYLLNSPPHPEERAHRLRYIIGNGMRPDVWSSFVERFQPGRVLEFYAATEGNVNMINPIGHVGSVGRMVPGPFNNALIVKFDHDAQAPVRGPDGRCIPCAPMETGELLGRINPDKVLHRYDGYCDDEASQKKILRDVVEPGDAWFRSGDLLKRDKWGWYYFVDRIGDTFRWKGENVSTNEVADAICRHEAIDVANVYGVRVEGADGRAGMAALVLERGAELDPEALYQHVERELASFARPAFVRLVDTASLTATFKLRKVDLVREGYDPSVVDGELYYRDDEARTYAPLDADALERIANGEIRL